MKLSHKWISNWGAKIIAVVLSLFVVLGIEFSTITNRVVRIPLIVYLPQSSSLVTSSLVPTSIDVVISGSEDLIYLVEPSDIHAYADFSFVDSSGIVRTPVLLEYNQDVYQRDALSVRADPSSVRILFSEAGN